MKRLKYSMLGALVLFLSCPGTAPASTVAGPQEVEPGKLVTFEADTPGVFLVIPAREGEFQTDSNGKRLYFATTTNGTYTLVHSCIEDGQIAQVQKTFTVGTPEPAPAPEPDPAPQPDPEPENSLTAAMQTAAKDLQSATLTQERNALRSAFEAVTAGIDDGTITAPEDARATLRITWQTTAITIGKDVTQRWKPVLDAASEHMDTTTLDGLKKGCAEAADALKESPAEGCKDGKCPTTRTYRYWR